MEKVDTQYITKCIWDDIKLSRLFAIKFLLKLFYFILDATDDAYWLDFLNQDSNIDKRAPSPRDLFKANYGKRAPSPRDLFMNNYGKRAPNPRDLFAANYGKRAPNPRDLFMNNYGKRSPNPRDLFASAYRNYE